MKKNLYDYLHFGIKSKMLMITGILWLSACSIVFAQQTKTVNGVVYDENNATLPGATVMVKGTTEGVLSDMEGKFTMKASEDAKTLVVSFIGMVTQEVAITSEALKITLIASATNLDQIVVVGYGVKKKSLVTGAISSVKAKDLKTTSTSRADQAIQGKVSGVMVLPTSGSPGAGSKIRVRGVNSNSNSNPLYIVDGMKTGDINNIDPGDIESLEVLKDAASSAIYGTEGANGVILITTKSGKSGKGVVNYDFQFGIQNVRTGMEMMDSTQYGQWMRESGLAPKSRFGANTDWLSETFQSAPMQKHHLSFSGGNDKTVYMVSGSYLTQDGIVGGDKANYKRYTTRMNIKTDVKKWLEVGGNLSYSHSNQENVGQDDEYRSLVNSALLIDPMTPVTYGDSVPVHVQTLLNAGNVIVKNDNGEYFGLTENVSGEMANPLAVLTTYHNSTEQDKMMGTGYLTIKPVKGLSFTSRIGLDLTYQNQHIWSPLYYFSTENQNGTTNVTDNLNKYNTWLWENFATYSKDFGDHSLTLLAGYSAQQYKGPVYTLYSAPMVAEGDPYANQGSTTSDLYDRTGGTPTENTMASMFGRLSYSFKNKYLLEGSVRRDGASVFPTDSKYAVFPAISAGWVVSNEDFFNKGLVTYVKMRASWGSNGSKSNLPGNEDKELWTLAGIKYPDATGTYQSGAQIAKLVNKDLVWERTKMADIGVDVRLMNNKIIFSADWYNKNTEDLIAPGTFPMSTGGGMPSVNAGTVSNKGLEFELSYLNQDNDFKYGVNVNLSTLKNEVTSLDVDAPVSGAEVRGYKLTWFEEGAPIWYFKGYKTDGIFNDSIEAVSYNSIYGTNFHEGDPIVIDVNGDTLITPSDQTQIGSPHPTLVYGGSIFLGYKGFDFNISFQGVSGNDIFMAWYRTDRAFSNKPAYMFEDRWTKDNRDASSPRADNTSDYVYRSDLMVSSGAYMRIKQIQLGYTLDNSLTSKFGVSSLRAYVSFDDYFTFTKYKGLDPEAGSNNNQSQGVDRGVYPVAAKFLFGLSASF